MKRLFSLLLAVCMVLSLAACSGEASLSASAEPVVSSVSEAPEAVESAPPLEEAEPSIVEEVVVEEPPYVPTEEEIAARAEIENALNLRNNPDQEWTYSASYDAWTLSVVMAVVNPELPDQQGVSVAVPGAYVTGIDTDGDGQADVMAEDGMAAKGSLVIDAEAVVTSSNGQDYTAATAPVILTTGAAGYGSQWNSVASGSYCADGYISVSCGNRGKQDSVTDEAGNVLYYTGDAPSCLCDQKAATRYVKYNMLLGNLPGSPDLFVSTGGSGGAAHASMFAATSNCPEFYDYQIEAGAVGVYKNSDGSYTAEVTIHGEQVAISDGAWGSVAYSTISSLYEADMAQAFEYYMDTTYSFNSPFQAQLAEYLSQSYMEYVNAQGWSVEEGKIGFDINADGDLEDVIDLTIEYDPEQYPDTNGYYGTYLDLYLLEFTQNLQWYLDNLPYGDGWTWFDESGAPMTDDAVASMTAEDKAECFLEGRYAKGSGGFGGPMGGPPGGGMGGPPGDLPPDMLFGEGIRDGGPMAGSTQSATGGSDSQNYASFEEMVAAYEADIAGVEAGDEYGKNIVELYNPVQHIGEEETDDPTWARIVMGAIEGDMPMMTSLNLQLAWLNAGTDAVIEWQWDGGHVPNEILGESLSLYVDMMYGKHEGGKEIKKPEAAAQAANGTETEMSGDALDWVKVEDGKVSFTLADVLKYRNAGAMKAVPGFDVIDYGQEDYVFGNESQDARHWNKYLLEIFTDPAKAEVLAPLFNQ